MAEVVRVSGEVAKGLVATGLQVGTVTTDFGPAVVRRAMLNGNVVFSITFPELEEKWVVVEGRLVAGKYVPIPEHEGLLEHATPVIEPGYIPAPEGLPFLPIDYVPQGEKGKPLAKKEEKKMEKKKPLAVKFNTKKKTGPKVEVPRSERPKTEIAKVKAKTGTVPEQPPTRRAFIGKKAPARVVVKGRGKLTRVLVPMRKPRSPQAKVGKIGPKAPVWRRQLDWKGNPEKIDINLYPVKILCATCGQPRYIDPRNAGVKDHPVTLCKPHARREHDDRHNAGLRKKTAEKREALVKAAKLACKALPKSPGKAASVSQDRRSPSKGTKVATKGAYKGRKARRRSEG